MNIGRVCAALTAVSLFLLPTMAAAETPTPAVADVPPAAAPLVEQQPLLVRIEINRRPIKNVKEAIGYAGEWILAGGLNDVEVGRVRQVGGLFIADLVAPGDRRKLQNQLLVRSRDGLGTLVYPASINGVMPKEVMAGMSGLEGLSGMTGINPAMQRKLALGEGKTISIRNGRRAVDSWLLHNGLLSLYAGNIRDLGGIFVSDIVDARGALKNQAVLRKADGLAQMINPVGSLAKMADAGQRSDRLAAHTTPWVHLAATD